MDRKVSDRCWRTDTPSEVQPGIKAPMSEQTQFPALDARVRHRVAPLARNGHHLQRLRHLEPIARARRAVAFKPKSQSGCVITGQAGQGFHLADGSALHEL